MRVVKFACFASAIALNAGMLAAPTKADIVLTGGTVAASFTDLGAQGFGNAPRLLTLQATGQNPLNQEGGQITYTGGVAASATYDGSTPGVPASAEIAARNDVPNPCCTDVNKSSVPTLGSVGWATANDVKLGLNLGETGGVTLENVVLSVYNNANAIVGTFALAGDVIFTAAQIALQTGNGNAVFQFELNAAQKTQFAALLALPGSSTFHIALASAFSNGATDGPDSWLAVRSASAPPVPIPGALILFGSGLAGLALLRRRMARRPGKVDMAAA